LFNTYSIHLFYFFPVAYGSLPQMFTFYLTWFNGRKY
jgi:hypothetical protein